MEDLQLLRHAQGYLKQLARGVDPISGRAVPEDSTLNQVRLSKCFQYVSEVLQREIDRIGPPAEPVTVLQVMADLCAERGFAAKKSIYNKAAWEWLEQEGLIVNSQRKGKDHIPTARGTALGLSAIERQNATDGSRFVTVLCNTSAQQFLRDSTDQIIAYERKQWDPLLACLTPEWRRPACTAEPVTLTALLKQIKSQLPEDLPRMVSAIQISDWLLWKGFLKAAALRKQIIRMPTEDGEALGIRLESWKEGSSPLWSLPAQQFLLDNLSGIVRDIASGEVYRWGPPEVVLTAQVRSQLRVVPKLVLPQYLEVIINSALGCSPKEGRPDLLPYNLISSWLFQEGYTSQSGAGGRIIPTEKGEAAGLVLHEGVICLSEAGQRFVYDHLDAIVDHHNRLRNRRRLS